MVGTYYSSPSPGSAAFIEVGKLVKVGDVICIIEAMKMETEVKATKSGIVKAVNISKGDRVAPGESLIEIE